MVKTKFWLIQLLMISVISLILGASAFAKAPAHSKGSDMKNAHASDQAKSKANSNAGFANATDPGPVDEPPVEEPPADEPPAGQCDENNLNLCTTSTDCQSLGSGFLYMDGQCFSLNF